MLVHGWFIAFSGATILAMIALFSCPIFSFLDKSEGTRIRQLDGLRGLCAFLVLFSHAVLMHNFWLNGSWDTRGGGVAARFANGGVWIFFMLSAYLMSGRYYTDKEGWMRFYVKRFFRIAPIAWLSVFLTLIVLIYLGGGAETKHISGLLIQYFDFGLGGRHANGINAVKGWTVNGGVMWTLRWEWLLYFSLPLLLFLRTRIPPYIISMTIIAMSYYLIGSYSYDNAICIASFGFGLLCRDLKGVFKFPRSFQYGLIILALFIIMGTNLDAWLELPAIFFLFFLVVNGEDFGGLLKTKGAVRLGDISYSTYLLHAIFLCILNVIWAKYHLPDVFYMPALFLTVICIVLAAAASFALLERPAMEYGRRLAKRIVPQQTERGQK